MLALVLAASLITALPPSRSDTLAAASVPMRQTQLDQATEERILALLPERISAAEVRDVLSRAPAPRIINLDGLALATMQPFAEFLIAMGYPEARLRDAKNGSLSRKSSVDSAQLAGTLAWYYENEGMMPMLIGHSQGGMLAVRVLHELAGSFAPEVSVWNPLTDRAEQRSWIVDPRTGGQRPVVGLKVPYAAALATGRLFRLLLGQWSMLRKVREIPDTVEAFTGFLIDWDPLAGTLPGADPYRATGSALVRNVRLGASTSHVAMPQAKELASNAVTRAWIERYRPDASPLTLPADAGIDTANLVHAADIWYSIKMHWCIEAQRLIRARRAAAESGRR